MFPLKPKTGYGDDERNRYLLRRREPAPAHSCNDPPFHSRVNDDKNGYNPIGVQQILLTIIVGDEP